MDIELEDNKQFISNIPRIPYLLYVFVKAGLAISVGPDEMPQNVYPQGLLQL